MKSKSQIMLIDGKNFAYRHHFAHNYLRSEEGKPTSVLYGCMAGLISMAKRVPDTPIAFVWDGFGPTWRHKLLDNSIPKREFEMHTVRKLKPDMYSNFRKSNIVGSLSYIQNQMAPLKKSKPDNEEVIPIKEPKPTGYKGNRVDMHGGEDHLTVAAQLPELKQVLMNVGFKQFEVANVEGDDLIGILMSDLIKKNVCDRVVIQSSDKDFFQFINDRILVLKRLENGLPLWADPREIYLSYGVQCEDWTKLRAIIGDPTDNIPRLFERVGPVTAAGWVNAGLNPSFEKFSQHPEEVIDTFRSLVVRKKQTNIEERWQEVHRNYKLCEVVTDPKAKCFDDRIRKEIAAQLEKVEWDYFLRETRKGMVEWFSGWCAQHQMDDLYGKRHELWKLV